MAYLDSMDTVMEPAREIPIAGRSDVLVVGGGPAGIGAAIAAARGGARTTIVERYGFLGGMWTAGLLNPILDYEAKGGLVAELMDRLREAGQLVDGPRKNFDYEYLKYLLDRMMAEDGVETRFHRAAADVVMDGDRIRGVITESKSGREALLANVVIDCTGDGDVCARAGVPFTKGRASDGAMQAVTLFFMLSDVRYRQARAGRDVYDMLARAVEADDLDYVIPYRSPALFELPLQDHATVQLAHAHGIDGTDADDLSRAEVELRAQIHEAVRVMQHVPELAGVKLVTSGPHIGVRETRHIHGRYVLEASDLLTGRSFEDGICWTRFNIDIHGAPDAGTVAVEGRRVQPYQIPYRSLLPINREHLLMAGRCISGTSTAHASFRVTGDCMAMGQAAGTAAALSVDEGVAPSALDTRRLVAQLAADGVQGLRD